MIIKYIGLNKLTAEESSNVKDMVIQACNKYDSKLKDSVLIFDIKKYHHKDSKTKYSIHARIENPHVAFSIKKNDWDLRRTLHAVFDAMTKQIHKKVKGIERGFTKDYEKG